MLYIKFMNQLYIYLHIICFLVRDSVNPVWLVLNKCILGSGYCFVSMCFAGHHDHVRTPDYFSMSLFPQFWGQAKYLHSSHLTFQLLFRIHQRYSNKISARPSASSHNTISAIHLALNFKTHPMFVQFADSASVIPKLQSCLCILFFTTA